MKNVKKLLLLSVGFLAMAATGCNNGGGNTSQEPVKEYRPIVFVMSGQSNMEGNTNFGTNASYLTKAFEDLGIEDGQCCIDGIESVQTSYYGNGYGELSRDDYNTGGQRNASQQPHASNTEDKIKGKFLNTKIGMGHSDSMMGPELGCAYALKDQATAEQPIYLVKMASSGSGFAQSGSSAEGKNWEVKTEDGTPVEHNLFSDFLKPGEKAKRDAYARRLADLIAEFRTTFAEYSAEGDEEGKEIAFIDGMTFEGGTMLAGADDAKALNEIKLAAADASDKRYIVDTYANEEHVDANLLKVSGDGSTQGVHYNTKDCFRLGMAYGKVILDNNLLD